MYILLVDDDHEGLPLRKAVLELRGHDVATASTATGARSVFASGDPDCVILDLRLPALEDGLALIRDFAGTRIIVVAGAPEDLDGKPERELVSDVLAKPVLSERLLAALSTT